MEVDGDSEDSDATVAGEEDLPATTDVRSAVPASVMTGPDRGSLSADTVTAAAQQSLSVVTTTSDVESEGADPSSPSLLHGSTASKRCFVESNDGKQRERHRSVGRQQRAEGHEKHYQQKAERYGQIRKNEEAKYNTTPERAERASENDDYTKEAAGKEVAVGPAHERKDSSSSDQLHYKDNDAHLDATSDKVGSPTTCSLDSQGIGTAAGGAKRFEKRISPGQMQSSGTAVKSTTKGNYDERRQYHRDRERSLSIQKLADNREQQCLQKADRYKQKKIDEEAKCQD